MNKRNPKSPWNPSSSLDITSEEYEKQVVEWLKASSGKLKEFTVNHLQRVEGSGGEYEFDAFAKFRILNGADIQVLVECKRHKKPVERKDMLISWAKLQDVKAHKAMIFSTSGFQSGAIRYADTYNIATITFTEGSFTYNTRAFGNDKAPPPWANVPKYVGLMVSMNDQSISSTVIESGRLDKLSEWLNRDNSV